MHGALIWIEITTLSDPAPVFVSLDLGAERLVSRRFSAEEIARPQPWAADVAPDGENPSARWPDMRAAARAAAPIVFCIALAFAAIALFFHGEAQDECEREQMNSMAAVWSPCRAASPSTDTPF